MPRRKEETVTLWESRYHNYEVNYEIRQEFKAIPVELQNRYHTASFYLPPWKLNRWGCPEMNDHLERQMIQVANQNGLDCVWFLIGYYTSDSGWEQYVEQFNALEPDMSYPAERFEVSLALSDTVKKLSTALVDN